MRIFPKAITEEVWREHLNLYSETLIDTSSKVFDFLMDEHKNISLNNLYICPLCLKHYFVNTESGIQGNAEFSLDHIPPESVGGKFKLITCKKCNNDSGTFESELEKMLNFSIDKENPNVFLIPQIQVRDLNTGKHIKGRVISKGSQTNILFNENAKVFNPKYVEFLSNLESRKIRLDIPLSNKNKIERALLKTAYLICFMWWGYEFVLSQNGTLLRKVINDEIKYPLPIPILWSNRKKEEQKSICCLLEYESMRLAFVIKIDLNGINDNTTAYVVIPNPTENGWSDLELINEIIKPNPKEFECIPLPRILLKDGYTTSWEIILPHNNELEY